VDGDKYKVKLEVYEGPLDLLLHLIKKDELDIYEISIGDITVQYMNYLDTFKTLNIPLASEFMVMAANLMYIKSRSLLPKKVQPPEEDAEDDDPKWDLIRQLLEYKKFKDAAHYLTERQTQRSTIFAKQIALDTPEEAPTELGEASIFDLVRAFQNVVKRFQDENELGEIQDDQYSVADRIDWLLDYFRNHTECSFTALFEQNSTKQEVIVTFMALLELVKLRRLSFRQSAQLGEIIIFKGSQL